MCTHIVVTAPSSASAPCVVVAVVLAPSFAATSGGLVAAPSIGAGPVALLVARAAGSLVPPPSSVFLFWACVFRVLYVLRELVFVVCIF